MSAEQTRASLYRRAADLPTRIDRPAVVVSRAGLRWRRPVRFLVASPWLLPDGRGRRHRLVDTYAQAIALANQAAQARPAGDQDGGDRG